MPGFKTKNPKAIQQFDVLLCRGARGNDDDGDIIDYFPHPRLGPHAHANGKFYVMTFTCSEEDLHRWMEIEELPLITPRGAIDRLGRGVKRGKKKLRKFDVTRLGAIEKSRLAGHERVELPTKQLVQQRIITKKGGTPELL